MIKKLMQTILTEQRWKLFALMLSATMFCIALLSYRLWYIGFDGSDWAKTADHQPTFIFLVWNLFLAWIPYWIALAMPMIKHWKFAPIWTVLFFVIWLLFFPNAPYIITDLLHLKHRPPVPKWFDVMLLFSFAWTGLMLGYFSLMEMQRLLRHWLSKRVVNTIIGFSLLLGSYGIYIGRFQRWNSWDIVNQPLTILKESLNTLLHPMVYLDTFGITFVLFGFLTLGYLVLQSLVHSNSSTH